MTKIIMINNLYESYLNYLTIENCLQSLQRLMSICFDIEMDKCLFINDENILKYELKKSITNEIIGILYLIYINEIIKKYLNV